MSLFEPTLLFDLAIDIGRYKPAKSGKTTKSRSAASEQTDAHTFELDNSYKLPFLGILSGRKPIGDCYVAWSPLGLYFQARILGKKDAPEPSMTDDQLGDGLRVWIDTRSSPGIHRATKFCHLMHFIPGLAPNQTPRTVKPVGHPETRAFILEIPRAKESPRPIDPKMIAVRSQFMTGGYDLHAFVPAICLTGYAPEQFDQISIFSEIFDRERQHSPLTYDQQTEYEGDPSLWIKARLVS